jgi:hypothetical protein
MVICVAETVDEHKGAAGAQHSQRLVDSHVEAGGGAQAAVK